MQEILYQEHSGAVAFEYIIVLIMMTIVLFVGLSTIRWQYRIKTSQIRNFLQNNGQNGQEEMNNFYNNSAVSNEFAKGHYGWDNDGQLTLRS